MYCIQCGVKLADSQSACPLCGTVVFHPDIKPTDTEPLYPKDKHPAVHRRSLAPQVVLTGLFLLPIITVLLCDLQLSGAITWAGYVIGALLVTYVAAILPSWFRSPNPVIFVPCSFAAVLGYVLYISLITNGSWFWSFALPLTGVLALIVTAVVTLLRYVKGSLFFVLGGAFAAFGLFMPMLEWLIMYTFDISRFIGWSLYPLTALSILGGLLIFLGAYRPAREAMNRKFFF